MEEIKPTINREMDGVSRISVPHLGSRITFLYSSEDPSDYEDIGRKILFNPNANLALPDGAKTASLLHSIYCGPEDFQAEPECVEFRRRMTGRCLYSFNINLWVPKRFKSAYGVFVIYDGKVDGAEEIRERWRGSRGIPEEQFIHLLHSGFVKETWDLHKQLAALLESIDIGKLEKSVKMGRVLERGIKFSEDGRVTFAPRDSFKDGRMMPEDFAKDGFVIASYGENGAKQMAEVSKSKYFKTKEPVSETRATTQDQGDEDVGCGLSESAVFHDCDRLIHGGHLLGGRWPGSDMPYGRIIPGFSLGVLEK